jgi:hypothetical protein
VTEPVAEGAAMALDGGAASALADGAALALADGAIPVCGRLILPYDTRLFPFAELLKRDVFGVKRLDLLHEYLRRRRRALGADDALTVQDNLTLRRLMQDLPDDSPFYQLYRSFMLKVLAPAVGRPLSYSNHPKMRVHLPDTPSVSSFHSDVPVTKRIDQVNFWMPFTDVDDTAALWLESCYGRGDYGPVPVRYGEVLIFDGGYLSHGSVPNRTQTTRVSLDMRFCLKGAATRAEGIDLINRLAARLL